MMRNQLENVALERGDSWFLYVLSVDQKKDWFLVQVTIDRVVVIASKIRDAERRNGKEWAGKVGLHAVSFRIFDKEKGLWGQWSDSNSKEGYPFDYSDIEKAKGKWDKGFDKLDGSFNFGFSRFGFRKPKPEEIPK